MTIRKDAKGKPLPAWMQVEKPWKRCDVCNHAYQTNKKKCGCGGTLR